jgi:transcriptional regulator with XRE-family HTH domain
VAHPAHLADPSQLPALLKRERERRKDDIQWKDLAAAAGVEYQSLQNFETKGATLSVGVLKKWLGALGLPQAWADDWNEWRLESQNEDLMVRAGFNEAQKQIGRLQFKENLRTLRRDK